MAEFRCASVHTTKHRFARFVTRNGRIPGRRFPGQQSGFLTLNRPARLKCRLRKPRIAKGRRVPRLTRVPSTPFQTALKSTGFGPIKISYHPMTMGSEMPKFLKRFASEAGKAALASGVALEQAW